MGAGCRPSRLGGWLELLTRSAYGWSDIDTTCDFFPDRPVEEDDAKVPWRYRWSDEVRDEVLARLLALNQERPGSGAVRSEEAEEDTEEEGEDE